MQKDYENKAMGGFLIKKVKIKSPIRGLSKDIVVNVKTDSEGTPLERYWRDRFKDAAIDGCVEIIQDKPRSKK